MTELTIQFNYVQDCVVLLRENFPLDLDYTEVSFGIHSER